MAKSRQRFYLLLPRSALHGLLRRGRCLGQSVGAWWIEGRGFAGSEFSPGREERQLAPIGFHSLCVKDTWVFSVFQPRARQASSEVRIISTPLFHIQALRQCLTLLDLICFFQERFQESLKKLRQEQQEAEKLKAVIMEKRASWKVRDYSRGVLAQEAGWAWEHRHRNLSCLFPTGWRSFPPPSPPQQHPRVFLVCGGRGN